MHLAVIVPVHHDPARPARDRLDRRAQLIACLSSLVAAAAQWRRDDARVLAEVTLVVVDDHSPQPVGELLPAPLRDEIRVERLGSHCGQGAALNRAMEAVPADLYAFTDSDCVVGRDWIRTIDRGAAATDDTIGTCGPPWPHLSVPDRRGRWLTANESRLVEAGFRRRLEVDGTTTRFDCRNLWLRADRLKPGWFPEDAGAALSGVGSFLAAERGERFRFDPALKVSHAAITSLTGQAVTYYRRGRTSDLGRHYAAGHRTLRAAFAGTYFRRHFTDPRSAGVSAAYVSIVHGAYWAGLTRRSLD